MHLLYPHERRQGKALAKVSGGTVKLDFWPFWGYSKCMSEEEPKRRGRPVTTGITPKRGIRIPDETWQSAVEQARKEGTSAGELCREFLDWWMRKPGAKLPKRPEPPA